MGNANTGVRNNHHRATVTAFDSERHLAARLGVLDRIIDQRDHIRETVSLAFDPDVGIGAKFERDLFRFGQRAQRPADFLRELAE